MYFLVQSNIYSDPDHYKMIESLENLKIEYETISLSSETDKIDISQNRKDVFVYGSVKLARLSKLNKDWYPGSFYGGNHLIENHSTHYGSNLLNNNYSIFEFNEHIEWSLNETKFIKPFKDAKIFTGKIFTKTKWEDFVNESLLYPKTPLLHKNSLVQWSMPQEIEKEARLWIIDDQIVEAVYYKFNKNIPFELEVSKEGIHFAKRMIKSFKVADAYVMDICLTNYGWKIVEINCINSAGFYPNVNVKNIVKALNIYFTK
jgi:hypothetical protein